MGDLGTVVSALLALSLVAVAVIVSRYQRLDLEKGIGTAVVRSLVQLTAIGYAIELIFGLESLGYVILLLAGMVAFAAWTSAGRGEGVSGAFSKDPCEEHNLADERAREAEKRREELLAWRASKRP